MDLAKEKERKVKKVKQHCRDCPDEPKIDAFVIYNCLQNTMGLCDFSKIGFQKWLKETLMHRQYTLKAINCIQQQLIAIANDVWKITDEEEEKEEEKIKERSSKSKTSHNSTSPSKPSKEKNSQRKRSRSPSF